MRFCCRLLLLSICLTFSEGAAFADSLLITYRLGKTQTVVLDEPLDGISSWQFTSGSAAEKTEIEAIKTELDKVKKENPLPGTVDSQAGSTQEQKPPVRFKWSTKPLFEN